MFKECFIEVRQLASCLAECQAFCLGAADVRCQPEAVVTVPHAADGLVKSVAAVAAVDDERAADGGPQGFKDEAAECTKVVHDLR